MIVLFFCKQKTAYEMRISDWSSDVCSSDLDARHLATGQPAHEIEAVDAGVDDDPASGHRRIVQPVERRRLEALVQEERVQPAEVGQALTDEAQQIGRASCRERVCKSV